MIWIDYIIIVVIGCSVVLGLTRGFVQEIMSLLSWGCAFFIAICYYSSLTNWFTGVHEPQVRIFLSILLLFTSTLIAGNILNYFIGLLIKRTGLSGINKILGVFFGVARGLLIVSIVLSLVNKLAGLPIKSEEKIFQIVPQFNFIMKWAGYHLKNISNLHSDGTIEYVTVANEGKAKCVVSWVSSVLCQ